MKLMENKQLTQVSEFMKVMGQAMPESPIIPEKDIIALRGDLIDEENTELFNAAKDGDIVEVADALCDTLYVVLGAFRAYGFSPELMEELFDEVQASNMSKLCKSHDEAVESIQYLSEKNDDHTDNYTFTQVGQYWVIARASDGKVLKSINWRAPDLKSILIKHGVKV